MPEAGLPTVVIPFTDLKTALGFYSKKAGHFRPFLLWYFDRWLRGNNTLA